MLQKAAPLEDGGDRWALLQVFFEQLSGDLMGFGRPFTTFSRLKGQAPSRHPRVALNRGEAEAEKASGSGFE